MGDYREKLQNGKGAVDGSEYRRKTGELVSMLIGVLKITKNRYAGVLCLQLKGFFNPTTICIIIHYFCHLWLLFSLLRRKVNTLEVLHR